VAVSGPVERRLLRQLPVVRWTLVASVAVGLVSTVAVVVQALALASLLTGAMTGARPGDRIPALAWLAASAAVRGLGALAGDLLARTGSVRAKAALRRRLLAAVLHRTPGISGGEAGDVATMAGRGLDALDVYVGRCLPDLVLAATAPLVLVIAVGAVDWLSAVILAVALALFPIFGSLVGRASTALATQRWRQVEGFGRQILDVFEGMAVLKAFGRSRQQRARIEQAGEVLRRASLSTLRVAFLSAFVLDELASVSVALVAVPLGLRLLGGGVSLASALAVLIVAPEVFLPLRRASAEFHESTEGLAAVRSVLDLVCAEGGGEGAAGGGPRHRPPDPEVAAVALRDVRVAVPGRTEPILDGAELLIRPGETVVLVGPNGAGKSTILSLLLGFSTPSSGAVTVGGRDLRHLDLDAWRRRIAYLPEHPTLLAGTLAENLRLANASASVEQLATAMAEAGASELLDALPDGLDTRLGETGRPISAGERQRIALARVLLRPASLYLLDEPTVHLDADTEAVVVARLRPILSGWSALVVTHRRAVLALADRVLTVADGRVEPLRAPLRHQPDGALIGPVFGRDAVPAQEIVEVPA
jgi:ATP-binding cassette, subfamily C, bacterial CydD